MASLNLHSSQKCLQRQLYLQNPQISATRFTYRWAYKSWFAVYFPFLALQSFKESCVKKKQQSDSTRKCAALLFWRTGIDQEAVSALTVSTHLAARIFGKQKITQPVCSGHRYLFRSSLCSPCPTVLSLCIKNRKGNRLFRVPCFWKIHGISAAVKLKLFFLI